MKELTIELTNFCPHSCPFCSSDTTSDPDKAIYLPYIDVVAMVKSDVYDRIILSGGDALFHPEIGNIISLCKRHSNHVIVYSNLITHIAYNAHVIDGIKVDCMITVPDDTSTVKILKRIPQGREKRRPEVTFSNNFENDCNCDREVVLPDGRIVQNNCSKGK